MLTRMAPLLTRMAHMASMLTRMTRWLAYYTHSSNGILVKFTNNFTSVLSKS